MTKEIINKKSSLKKWEDEVDDLYEMMDRLREGCGYCENTRRSDGGVDCTICPLKKKNMCGGQLISNCTFDRVMRALHIARDAAEELREGIEKDIEETLKNSIVGLKKI